MGSQRYRGFPAHGDPRYFDLAGLRGILERAMALGYDVVPFRAFERERSSPVLLLRHDIDWSLDRALPVLELEAELGVAATVFVLTTGELYDLRSAAGRQTLRRFAELGHEVGLHYPGERYSGPAGRSLLDADLALLEEICGRPVVSASQHLPLTGRGRLSDARIVNDAYEPRFIESPLHYVSDSLMVWRQATPHDLLERKASFQFLAHPETWSGHFNDMGEALSSLADASSPASRAVFDRLAELYGQLLADRERLDRRFRADSVGVGQERA